MHDRLTWPAWGTFWWGILFGGLNLFWSFGGELGLNQMGVAIQDEVAAGSTSMLVLNTIGGFGKIVAGVLALATIKPWAKLIPRRLLSGFLYAVGVMLLLYGGANWTQILMAETGVIDIPASIGPGPLRWYLFLWEPLWIAGGAMMLLTADVYRRHRR